LGEGERPRRGGGATAALPSPIGGAAALGVLFLLAGCASTSTDLGGRPLLYKVGPGDPPNTIHTSQGIVYKKKVDDSAPASAQAPGQAAGATQPAAVEAPPAPPSAVAAASAPPAPAAPVASPPVAAAAAPPVAAALAPGALDSRYTQASRYGDLLFLSGQIAMDLVTGEPVADRSIEAQTRKVMENIQRILEAHGLTMANVVSTQVFLRSINNLGPMDAVYRKFFKGTPPARTIVEVSNLPRGMEIEISVIAGK